MRLTRLAIILITIIVILILSASTFFIFLDSPKEFPVGSLYIVPTGSGLNLVSEDLTSKKIIRSPFWFKTFSVLFGGTKGIMAGDYALSHRENTITLAYRLAQGDFNLEAIKITIQEGLNVMDIGKLLSVKFSKIDENLFIDLAKAEEGYLFPDTYLFLPNVESADVIKALKTNFDKKILGLETEITAFNKPLSDIIKMASIVEREARTMESRQMIAGILWKRLEIGMPLQVDVSFKYINGKTTSGLTLEDLKIDSPYNSYLYKGLPPTPIANPGLGAIKATVTPTKSDYLYFLSDNKGKMHYAKTYQQHLQNKELYLR